MFSYPFKQVFINFLPKFLKEKEIIYITDGETYLLTEGISITGRDIEIDSNVKLAALESMDSVMNLIIRVIEKYNKFELLPDVKKYIDIMVDFRHKKIIDMISKMTLN